MDDIVCYLFFVLQWIYIVYVALDPVILIFKLDSLLKISEVAAVSLVCLVVAFEKRKTSSPNDKFG